MKVYHQKTGYLLGEKVKLASTFKDRLLGLMFSTSLPEGEGLLLDPCYSIHTCFMNYPIDVIFLSKTNEVVAVFKSLKPWRVTRFFIKAQKTLELPEKSIPDFVQEGDFLELKND